MPTNEELFATLGVGVRIEPNDSGWCTTIVRRSPEGELFEETWPTRSQFSLALQDARTCAPNVDLGGWHAYGKWQLSACQSRGFTLVIGIERTRRDRAA